MKQLIVFKSTTCAPCVMLSNVMKNLELPVQQITTVDIAGNKDIAIEHNVRQVPTCIIIEQGKETKRKVGVMTASQILEFCS